MWPRMSGKAKRASSNRSIIKGKNKINVGLLLNRWGVLVTEDTEEAVTECQLSMGLHWQDQPSGMSDSGDQDKGML